MTRHRAPSPTSRESDSNSNNGDNELKEGSLVSRAGILSLMYCCFSAVGVFCWQWSEAPVTTAFSVFLLVLSFIVIGVLQRTCPEAAGRDPNLFRSPLSPWLPAIGIMSNWYLVAQLETAGLLATVLYVVLATVIYGLYGYRNSKGRIMWDEDELLDVTGSAKDQASREMELELATANEVKTKGGGTMVQYAILPSEELSQFDGT